ncbi:hypothetical protein IW140_006106 [Coemansia sp. RSA 1813]|nr:hypothetical protein EV178_006075 [Coemansia sp. RSA 1646]KAJ1765969.1 hypothetical protein LPJ74_006118 [Coemansia sp. RSA 1843]KAJ2085886.1 hypothetical protein IW138_006056 [Coemansia sp. RSA 986]KAJ2210714.1 hypothetical protein EV179_006042 [Coemansia sp. RSA 487]KAJ2563447.1 hypothetical protein IW140_006106 [Coemansia sp. RSA 1813]
MSQLEPSKLKVTELRTELTARNLPTNGLKKDLVKRLEDALMGVESDKHAQHEADDGIELLPASGDAEAFAAASSDNEIKSSEHVSEKRTDRREAHMANKDDAEDDFTMDAEEPLPTTSDGDSHKRKLPVDKDNEDRADGAPMDTDEPEASMPLNSSGVNENDLGSKTEVADSFFIKNLERPLTIFRIKEFLAAFGTVEDAWLNSIKTRGYVSFATKEESEAAFNGINGTRFPPEHGKILECGFITKKRMKQLVSDEERMSDSVRDTDLVAVQNDGSNCGISLVNKRSKAKNTAKKHRGDDKPGEAGDNKDIQIGGKGANKSAAVNAVSIAATAAADDAKHSSKNKAPNGKNVAPSQTDNISEDVCILMPVEADALTRKTKTQPSIVYRPLTDEEVAAKRAAASAGSTR